MSPPVQAEAVKPGPSPSALSAHLHRAFLLFSSPGTSAPQAFGRYGLDVCLHGHMSVCVFNPLKTGTLAKHNKNEFLKTYKAEAPIFYCLVNGQKIVKLL